MVYFELQMYDFRLGIKIEKIFFIIPEKYFFLQNKLHKAITSILSVFIEKNHGKI